MKVPMKKYRILFISIPIVVLFLTGCKKDFLEQKVYTSITAENFFKSEEDFKAALAGLYTNFRTDFGYMYNPDESEEYPLTFATTDEIWTNGYVSYVIDFSWGPASFNGNRSYSRIQVVGQATDVIDKISKSTVADAIKEKYISETKVIRALLMLYLYDNFGPLNPRLDPNTLTDVTVNPRMSKNDYLNFILQDVSDALASPTFPETTNDNDDQWGRFNKGVARMIKLRLYMQDKQWDKAEAAAREIIGMNYYSLQPNYEDVFIKKQNKEVIWAVHNDGAFATLWMPEFSFPGGFASGYAGTHHIVRGDGWDVYFMPWKFFSKFKTNDLRRNTIIYEYTDVNGNKIDSTNSTRAAIPLKYVDANGDGPYWSDDFVVFRYAEVLLSLAEAINEQRGPADAYLYVNPVRERAGVADYSGLTQSQLRDSLLDERGRELYLEGVRRLDLIRNGSFISNALARGKTNAKPYMTLFPIPADVIIQGRGIIEQNPGY
jgi:starch-binding outer membrane protein, SusD/RagB family